jgi:hypothetical protein
MTTTWSSDHSAIYRNLHLCLAIANDLSLATGFTRIDQKVTLMQLGHQFNSYNLMHMNNNKQDIRINITQVRWLDSPGLASLLLRVNFLDWCWLLKLLEFWLRVIYRKYASMRHQHKYNA